ncbi:MAG: stage II sporulation protein E [Clostridium cadaveris]|uniref:Stage II sporulation protein E n=1 Tax=Clostridium cadaveris TaxID=1529 RepID=A0A1I2NGD2_9CLOT|nr:stage II sporulation protein E [Clostridium cadaveris]MDY4949554.1 stage II sporulation protein E [Clostridium cadaveris]NWK09945.1 stage II sporulation protein E [Clostridium cadaveris]SFG02638.1 stage II sporulation protein E [Clostridium cadaveris]
MQIGAEINTYKREQVFKEENQGRKATYLYKIIIYFILSMFVSRAILINETAPFGVALALTIVKSKDNRLSLSIIGGSLIGYLTLFSAVDEGALYIMGLITIGVLNYVLSKSTHKKKLIAIFSLMFLEIIAYRYIMHSYNLGINVLMTTFNLGCIFPIYFIMDYALLCSKELKTKHLFSSEEIISMTIIGCLVISGTWGMSIFGMSLRNIFGLIFIMIIAYINGSAIGAAAGVAMGIIVGMSSNNMMNFISIYGVCGLIVGVFKETGKWFTALAYIVIFSILKFYSGINEDVKLLEGIVNMGMFLMIPERIYDRWSLEFDWERKQEAIGKDYIDKIKETFNKKLNSFSDILGYMSTTLNDLVDNDKIFMQKKSSGLIENLADKVCGSCDMRSTCWKREFHYTYAAFGELIQNYQEDNDVMPVEIERKCIKRTALSKVTEEIVNSYIISEMWRKRLSEGRELLSGQIRNMATTINGIMEDFDKEVNFDIELEMILRKALNKKDLGIKDILCYEDKYNRLHINMEACHCGGNQKCIKQVLPLVNEVSERIMCVGDDGCNIDGKTGRCKIVFEETPKYHVATYVQQLNKEGEAFNGDSYSFEKLADGTYMTVISDGMGCGYDAYKESKASVELIEKFAESGFGREATINTVNSIMGIRFSEEEKFSTLDLNSIDLYDGNVTFIKVGAGESFIKSGEDVETIRCKTLPIGVLDKVDLDIIDRKIGHGDMILTLSDGIIDAGRKDWIADYLKNIQCNNPKELAEDILNKAKELSGAKVKDDMTVIVSKIYSLY